MPDALIECVPNFSEGVDRAKVASLVGLDSRPACQLLPPYVPELSAKAQRSLERRYQFRAIGVGRIGAVGDRL